MARAVNSHPPETQIAPLTPGPVGRSGNRIWRWARRMRPVLVHVLVHGAARIRGNIDRGQDAAAVPGARRGRPAARAARLSGRGCGWLGPSRSARQCSGVRNGACRLTAPTAEEVLRDQGRCRRQAPATALVAGAVDWARKNGARVLDACPVDAGANRPPISLYHGLVSTFRRAGFHEVARRRPDRPLICLKLSD